MKNFQLSKIYIMGPPGSGKTSFAKKISCRLKIPNFDLDDISFRKDKYKKINEKSRDKKLSKILKNKKWIIEGSYAHPWIIPAVKKADLIIILNKHFRLISRRIFLRYIRRKLRIEKAQKGAGSLRDLAKLIYYAQTYSKDYFIKHTELAKKFNKKTIIFTKRAELINFINQLY